MIVLDDDVKGLDCPMERTMNAGLSIVRGCFFGSLSLSIVHFGTGVLHEPALRAHIVMKGARCNVSGF